MCLCLWMIAHMFGAEGSALLSARASLVCLLVHRSSVCSCIARLPARASLVCRSFAATLLETWALVHLIVRLIVCLIVHRSSVCSCIARLSDRLSARASLVCLIVRLIVHRSSV